jgi:hypothetical protein
MQSTLFKASQIRKTIRLRKSHTSQEQKDDNEGVSHWVSICDGAGNIVDFRLCFCCRPKNEMVNEEVIEIGGLNSFHFDRCFQQNVSSTAAHRKVLSSGQLAVL